MYSSCCGDDFKFFKEVCFMVMANHVYVYWVISIPCNRVCSLKVMICFFIKTIRKQSTCDFLVLRHMVSGTWVAAQRGKVRRSLSYPCYTSAVQPVRTQIPKESWHCLTCVVLPLLPFGAECPARKMAKLCSASNVSRQ